MDQGDCLRHEIRPDVVQSRAAERTWVGVAVARPKQREKVVKAQAQRTQTSQEEAAKARARLRHYYRRRALGWGLVVLGILIGVEHWLEHLTVLSLFPRFISEVGLGYPIAAALVIAGAIVLSK